MSIVLPIAQSLVAIVLLVTGYNHYHLVQVQRGIPESSTGSMTFLPQTIWDYNEPALELTVAINFPVIVLLSPALAVRPPFPLPQVLYIMGVILFWFWVGRNIDRRYTQGVSTTRPTRSPLFRLVFAAGALAAGTCGVFALTYVLRGIFLHLRFLAGAIFVWSAIFCTYFVRKLVARRQPQSDFLRGS